MKDEKENSAPTYHTEQLNKMFTKSRKVSQEESKSFTRRVQTQESKKYHFIFVRAREPSRAEAEPLYSLTSGRRFLMGKSTQRFFLFLLFQQFLCFL